MKRDTFGVWVPLARVFLCAAVFALTYSARASVQEINCESSTNGYNACPVDGEIVSVQFENQLSDTPCNYLDSWGYDNTGNDSVWVDKGCSAVFSVLLQDKSDRQAEFNY